jgi:hypothetical protein
MSGTLESLAKLRWGVRSGDSGKRYFVFLVRLTAFSVILFFALLPENRALKNDVLNKIELVNSSRFRSDDQKRVDGLSAFLITMTTSEESIEGEPLLSLKIDTMDRIYLETGTHIQIKYSVENVGDDWLVIPFKINDDLISNVECPRLPINGLAPHQKMMCFGEYVVVAADVHKGSIFHSAFVETQRDFVKSVSSKIWQEIHASQFPPIIHKKISSRVKLEGYDKGFDTSNIDYSSFGFESTSLQYFALRAAPPPQVGESMVESTQQRTGRIVRGGYIKPYSMFGFEEISDVVSLPDFQCSALQGTVFEDKNYNGVQDSDEPGLAGVQITTLRNGLFRSDMRGHFKIDCIDMSGEFFTQEVGVKLDLNSLPVTYHLASKNSRYVKFQNGRFEDLNFPVVKRRLVRFDVEGEAFAVENNRLLPEWQFTIGHVISALRKEPSILKLSYLLSGDPYLLGKSRVQTLKEEIMNQWLDAGHPYELNIDTQVVGKLKN